MPPKNSSADDVRRQPEPNFPPGIVAELDQFTFSGYINSSERCLGARREHFATMIPIGRARCSNACTFNEFVTVP
jgi:hypothetical protein